MNAEDVVGLIVLVHPLLWNDPAGRTGQIGIITDADRDQDNFTVRFDDKVQAHYSAGALQVLQSPEKLYELMENHRPTLAPAIRHGLSAIALLQHYGASRHVRAAFELVRQHEHLQTHATRSLEEVLAEHRDYKVGR